MTALSSVRTALKKRAAFIRTKREIESLPRSIALEDLGIYPGDADEIAYKAVYG